VENKLNKVCSFCGLLLPSDKFSKVKKNKSGLSSCCRDCSRISYYKKKGIDNPPQKIKPIDQINNKICNKCKKELPKTQFCLSGNGLQGWCKDCKKQNKIETKAADIDKYRAMEKKHRIKSKQNFLKRAQENPNIVAERKQLSKRWEAENKEYRKEYIRQLRTRRLQSDPSYKIRINLRNRFKQAVFGMSFSKNVQSIVGCSIDDFKLHLENQFEPWMNWGNYGVPKNGDTKWQMDHIIPLSCFDPQDQNEIYIFFNYRNIQPLNASINGSSLLKGDNLEKAKEFLLKKIQKFGLDPQYEKMLIFLDEKIKSQSNLP